MSYLRKTEYSIVPEESYKVIRNCSGCGCKSFYRNTNNFRVNANGKKLDVWLIYQCERCKHTLNLSIYRGKNPAEIPKEQYKLFLANDRALSESYGTDRLFFAENKAEIDIKDIACRIVSDKKPTEFLNGDLIEINYPNGLKIRPDKLVANLLGVSRNIEKKLEQGGIIEVVQLALEQKIRIWVKGDIKDERGLYNKKDNS